MVGQIRREFLAAWAVLLRNGEVLALEGDAPSRPDVEAITHSDRLALVDRGNRVVGIYESTDAEKFAAVAAGDERATGDAR